MGHSRIEIRFLVDKANCVSDGANLDGRLNWLVQLCLETSSTTCDRLTSQRKECLLISSLWIFLALTIFLFLITVFFYFIFFELILIPYFI